MLSPKMDLKKLSSITYNKVIWLSYNFAIPTACSKACPEAVEKSVGTRIT